MEEIKSFYLEAKEERVSGILGLGVKWEWLNYNDIPDELVENLAKLKIFDKTDETKI